MADKSMEDSKSKQDLSAVEDSSESKKPGSESNIESSSSQVKVNADKSTTDVKCKDTTLTKLDETSNEESKDTSKQDKPVHKPSTAAKTSSTSTNKSYKPNNTPSSNNQEIMDKDDTLHTMAFNQDGGCLAVGTGSGFRICNVHPFHETFRRRLGDGGADGGGGIAQIEMLYRTNLLALTVTSSISSATSHYPPNKVMIYDDHDQRTIGQLNFRSKVIATRLRRDRVIVVLRDRIYIYNFSDFGLLDKVHTGDNPRGLVGISIDNGGVGGSTVERAEDVLGVRGMVGEKNGLVLACPSTQRGQVRVELYGLRRTTFVDAHESALGALALSVDGSLLATASERGTVIRLFDTRGVTVGGGRAVSNEAGKENSASLSSSVPLREFRRGVERATISCLTFSLDSCWLAAASDHGTVHIFRSQDASGNSSKPNSQKSASSMTGKAIRMLPKIVVSPTSYFVDGEQSIAQVRGVPHPRTCAFVPDRECTIAVAGEDEYGNGCLLLAEFGKSKNATAASGKVNDSVEDDSEARRLSYHRFFKKDNAAAMHGKSSRRRVKSKDWKGPSDMEEGGAFIDDGKIDLRMNHIHIGDATEDDFVPIDLDSKK